MRTRLNTVGACVLVYGLAVSPAWAQPSPEASDATEIERIAKAFLDSISSTGIDNFQGLAFPCYIIIPGEEGALVVVGSERDLDKPGERVNLTMRDLAITLAGDVAAASLQFKPPDAETWASATLILTRPAGFWVVRIIGFSPNRLLLDSDVDAIRTLRADFVRSITTAGPMPFEGLQFPFLYANGRSGTVALIEDPADLGGDGRAIRLSARNERVTYADALATVTMDLVSPDEELTGADVAALVCTKTAEGWRVVAMMVGPAAMPAEGPTLDEL